MMSSDPESLRLGKAVTFVDRVLHDLKQPLNVIRVVAQDVRLDVKRSRLEVDTLPASMLEVERAVDELTGRIDQLRAFARRSHETAEPRLVLLEEACMRALRETRRRYPEARVRFELTGEPVVCSVPAHVVEWSVLELVDNGVRAADEAERPAELRIAIGHREEIAVVSIEDNGCGIEEDARERIFQPFFSTWTSSGGLGLTLASALASACAGAVTLVSTASSGSAFELTFPVGARLMESEK
jgi:signal transduction histidine kinase